MIGIIGGSGFYELLEDGRRERAPTAFGDPAADPVIGTIANTEVAFLPRHGANHQFPPHRVPYRANIAALQTIGVDRILATAAVGSLAEALAPGHFAVPDQLVDRTWGRNHTFFDGPDVEHVTFADPYDAGLRIALIEGMGAAGAKVRDGGTVVVVNGPRFSTRAESAGFAAQGWEMINMTQMPEAALAAEAGIRYAAVAVITDYDVGLGGVRPVSHQEVLRRFEQSSATLRAGLVKAVDAVGEEPR